MDTKHQEAPVDRFIPALGLKLRSGLDADLVLAGSITSFEKVLFLLTNAPFWFVCVAAMLQLWNAKTDVSSLLNTCEHPLTYAILGFLVAFSSTLMHGAQLRMGLLLCCGHGSRAESFHREDNQVLFKKFDISCAMLACLAVVSCHEWSHLVVAFSVAVPLFVLGLYFKRVDWHKSYLASHGLWHFVIAVPILIKFL